MRFAYPAYAMLINLTIIKTTFHPLGMKIKNI
jgi:hypothetical protein